MLYAGSKCVVQVVHFEKVQSFIDHHAYCKIVYVIEGDGLAVLDKMSFYYEFESVLFVSPQARLVFSPSNKTTVLIITLLKAAVDEIDLLPESASLAISPNL